LPVENYQGNGRSAVQADQKRQVKRFALRLAVNDIMPTQ
jgi:hypothetical protein